MAFLKGGKQVLDLDKGEEWVIGRDPELSDLLIEDLNVSREHAIIKKRDGIYLIHNVSHTRPILVNDVEYGRDVEEEIELHEGDRVSIADHVFTFHEGKAPAKRKKKEEAYDELFGDLGNVEEPPPPAKEEEGTTYDEIFEETPDGELPMELFQRTRWMLKVFTGPQAGKEISLEPGRPYVIGRDPNQCNIVFHDQSVSHEHAKLTVEADGRMELEDLSSKNKTLVHGKAISGKVALNPGELVTLGTTTFRVIDLESEETVFEPGYETPVEEEVAAAALGESDWKKKPLPLPHLLTGGALAFLGLVLFMVFFSLFKSNQVGDIQKESVGRIKEALAKFNDVQFSFNPSSAKLFVVGHVGTSVEFQEMVFRLSEVGFIRETENSVVIDELVWKSTNDVIADNADWRGVALRSKSAGKFEAVGYVQTAAQLAALQDFFTVNFPYLDRLENNVVVEDALNAQIQGLLVQSGFGGVAFQLNGTEVMLTGNYSNKMQGDYEKLLKELNTKVHGLTRVQNFAIPTNPSAVGINVSDNYQVTGVASTDGHGYSAILNGKICTVGQFVDGMKITKIEPSTILLEKDGVKYKIDYRQ
jgi:type III secretion system YscD/HrpQ family protein